MYIVEIDISGSGDPYERHCKIWDDVQWEYEVYIRDTCCNTPEELADFEYSRGAFFTVHGLRGDEPPLLFRII